MTDQLFWKIVFKDKAKKILRKLDHQNKASILNYLEDTIGTCENPRQFGHKLTGPLREFWRYRVGDYRVICHFSFDTMTVMVVDIGHRSVIYKQKS